MKTKLNTKQKREPIGGHHFNQKTKHSDEYLVKADTFNKLISKVSDYRISNGIPIGNPKEDVLEYYARRFPYMVLIDEGAEKKIYNSRYEAWRTFIQDVWKKAPTKFITRKESESRWTVCLDCPFNVEKDWKKTKESNEVEKRAFMLRRGEAIPKKIGFCALHRADIGVLSFVEAPGNLSGKKKDHEKPSVCWV